MWKPLTILVINLPGVWTVPSTQGTSNNQFASNWRAILVHVLIWSNAVQKSCNCVCASTTIRHTFLEERLHDTVHCSFPELIVERNKLDKVRLVQEL